MGQEIIKKSVKKIWQKWSIAFRIVPIIAVVALLKFLAHIYHLEFLELNALFTSLVAGTIFLIGFLITGVLSDYKESEKIPSELSSTLKCLLDDSYTLYKAKNSDAARQFIEYQKSFIFSLKEWFYKKETTTSILNKISLMNEFFISLDKAGVQPNYIIKMKNDQNAIRKTILRIDTIRDTDFVGSAYAIVEIMWTVLAFGLILIKIEPFYASLFFTIIVIFLISYMFFLIKDLDNPFDYSVNGETGTEISLQPLHDFEKVLMDFN